MKSLAGLEEKTWTRPLASPDDDGVLGTLGITPNRRGRSMRNHQSIAKRGGIATLLAVLMLAGATVLPNSSLLGPDKADAMTVRGGARWYQIDVLLDRNETRSVATSGRQAVIKCAGAIGLAAPVPGLAQYVGAVCVSMLTVCSARAVAQNRRAGITFEPHRAWCWTY